MNLTYRGQLNDGTPVSGTLSGHWTHNTLAAWTKHRWQAGWLTLDVTTNDGTVRARITTSPDTGKRIWWSE